MDAKKYEMFPHKLADVKNENVKDLIPLQGVYAIGQLETDLGYDSVGIVGKEFRHLRDVPKFEGVYEVDVLDCDSRKKCILFIWEYNNVPLWHRGYVCYQNDEWAMGIAKAAYEEKKQIGL